MNDEKSPFQTKQVWYERRTLSKLGRLAPYQRRCIYGLLKAARDRLTVRIALNYKPIEVLQVFLLEGEQLFYVTVFVI